MKLIFNTTRDAYSTEDIRSTMTTGELIQMLEGYDEDTPVFLSFDNGYTYGAVREGNFEEEEQ